MECSLRSLLTIVVVVFIVSSTCVFDVASSEVSMETPNAYRTITHVHTCFSHDTRFGSEPSLQLDNLRQLGYQAVLVAEHDYNTISPAQTDFAIPPFKNGGFEVGSPYPSQWRQVVSPRNSSIFLNVTDSDRAMEGDKSFHLELEGIDDEFDLLSWSYREVGSYFTRDRPIAFNLWLKFSVFFSESPSSSDSVVYISCTFGRRDDPMFPEISNKLSFYFFEEVWVDESIPDLINGTNRLSIRLDSPPVKGWQTYTVNITDYAFRLLPTLGDVPAKYLMLKQLTLSLASRRSAPVELWVDDVQVFSQWTSAEMYDWWRSDIEGYSNQAFLVVAGLETSLVPHIGAYGLTTWHNFSVYNSVEERVSNIQALEAVSSLVHPRASNFTAVSKGGGWGAELFEVFTTVHDQAPSSQVLNLWDDFLSQGSVLFAIAGFDSHGLLGTPGASQPTVANNPIYENLVIAESLDREHILTAIRHGRMYIVRSDQALKMSFSAGAGGPQQGATIISNSANTEVVITVYLEGISPGSELLVIKDDVTISKIPLEEEQYYQEMNFPLTGKDSYIRLEIRYMGERIAISNPIFFHKVDSSSNIWATFDHTIASLLIIAFTLVFSPVIYYYIRKVHALRTPKSGAHNK